MPAENVLTPADKGKWKIVAKSFADHDSTNIVTRYTFNNSRGFKVPTSFTEQYRCSFFVQAVMEWNKLEENVVQASSNAAFSAALRRAGATAAL